jgi:hypothetical protein
MQVRQSWFLAVAGLALSMLTACVEPGDNTHVYRGTYPTAELTQELDRLGVTLPDDRSHLEWLMVNEWDSNDTYVRLTASRGSVLRLLDQSNIEESSLQALGTAGSNLVRACQCHDWQWVLPQDVLSHVPTQAWGPAKDIDWSLTTAQRESAVAHYQEDGMETVGPIGLRAAGAVVVDLQGAEPLVMLHWYR